MYLAPPRDLLVRVQDILKAEIKELKPVMGGCISPALLLGFTNYESAFLKWNLDVVDGFFEAEAHGLKALRQPGVIIVPEVLSYSLKQQAGVPPYILLETLELGSKTVLYEETLGRQLAQLHQCRGEEFGFDTDNFIGSLPQKNTYSSSWSEFFFDERLVSQAELGIESGWFNWEFQKLLSGSERYIKDLLSESNEKPSLLHGDLWSGNIFWSTKGPALIDPAVYYGNREADIAFSELFGGFGSSFYSAYNAAYPLSEGYEERKTVLNLYHLMTHSNLFGGSYIASVKRVLQKLAIS